MTIQEAMNKKTQLEHEIFALCEQYTQETGAHVSDVRRIYHEKDKRMTRIKVSVFIEADGDEALRLPE